MTALIVKLILLLFGTVMLRGEVSAVMPVTAFLAALTLTSFNQYLNSKKFTAASSVFYFAASVFFPCFCVFLPLFSFDLFMVSKKRTVLLTAVPIISLFTSGGHTGEAAFLAPLIAIAAAVCHILEKSERLAEENRNIRDAGAEINRMLAEKNEHLIENQNYEIHLATLKERNRIAREIHDNVGHILSRSILQTGAMQITNKDENIAKNLTELNNALSLAMDAIRNSVHDLRDESVDLYESIRKMTERQSYEIIIDYDVAQDLSNNIKYCFLSVLKEAFTNIAKHSDARKVRIAVVEHPAMYQLLIHDDGKKDPRLDLNSNSNSNSIGRGMGLCNMKERAEALGGSFSVSYKNGFRIFISVPKKEQETIGL